MDSGSWKAWIKELSFNDGIVSPRSVFLNRRRRGNPRQALKFYTITSLLQYNLTLKHGVTGTNDSTVRNELYEQLVSFIDLILDGRKCHLNSVHGTEKYDVLLKQYETDRTNLIQPLSMYA